MKHFFLLSALLAAVLFCGCSNTDTTAGGGGIETVALTIPIPAALRLAGSEIVVNDSIHAAVSDSSRSLSITLPARDTVESLLWVNLSDTIVLGSRFLPASPQAQASAQTWLLITGTSDTLDRADNALRDHLHAAGFIVIPTSDSGLDMNDLAGIAAVCISTSVDTDSVAIFFRDSPVPVLTNEHYLLDDLGMTGPLAADSIGLDLYYDSAIVASTGSPLAMGLSGTIAFLDTLGHCDWGIPEPTASIILVNADTLVHSNAFVYEQGSFMHGITAPARRGAFCFWTKDPLHVTAAAWTIFTAMAQWIADQQQ